jgi:ketosteroid isomerase-like protein
MPSPRPSDVLRAYFATFTAGGLEAAAQLWDPEIEWHALDGHGTRVVRGDKEMRRHYAEWVDTIDALGAEIGEVVCDGDDVTAVRVRNFGRGRLSGVPVSGSYYIVCVVRDGRLLLGREHATREQALRDAEAVAPGDD